MADKMMGSVVCTPGSQTTAAMASTRAIVATGPAALSPLKAAINRTGLQHQQLLAPKILWLGAVLACCACFRFLTIGVRWPSKALLTETLCLSLSKAAVTYAESKVAYCLTVAPAAAKGLEGSGGILVYQPLTQVALQGTNECCPKTVS